MPGTRIERTNDPRRIRGAGDGDVVYEVPLNAAPDRFWRSRFLDQHEYSTEFVPDVVRFTYHPPAANFQCDPRELRQRLRLLDAWIEHTNRRLQRPPAAKPGEGAADDKRKH